jgi:hypothetical protein
MSIDFALTVSRAAASNAILRNIDLNVGIHEKRHVKLNGKLEIIWLILIALSIGCASTPRATPHPDQPAPTATYDIGAPYGATPVKSPDGNAIINHLVVAPDGAVWFSFGSYDWAYPYGGGVSRYHQGQLTHFTSDDDLPHENVQALRVAPDGSVWIGALCGIARYAVQAWQIINKADDCESVGGPVIDFAFTPDGSVWVGTALNVARFDGQQWTRYDHLFGWLTTTTGGAVWATGADDAGPYLARFTGSDWIKFKQLHSGGIAFSYDASLWILEQHDDNGVSQLAHLNGQTWEIVPVPTLGLSNFAIAPDSTPWALTTQGVARFDGTQWLLDTNLTGDFTSMTFASDGTLWLGGRGGQLAHYQPTTDQLNVVVTPLPTPTPYPTFTPDPSAPAQPIGPAPSPSVTPIPQLPVTNLVVTSDGAVWYSFGNFDFHPRRGGIVREAQGQQTRFMPEATVQLLKVAPDGSLWAGMGCGLLRFDGQTWQTVIENCDKLHGNVSDLAFTSDGTAWIAAGFKLARYQNGEWTIIDRLIDSIEVTSDGTLWASGWEGTQGSQYLARFDGAQWTIVERAVIGLLLARSDGSVWVIKYELPTEPVWAMGNGGSLVRFAGTDSKTLTDLPFDQADDLESAPNGDLWAITDRGVVHFDGTHWQLASNLPDDITQIAFSPDGSIRVGNWAGKVSRVDPAAVQFTILPARPAPTSPAIDPSLPTPAPPPTLNPSPTQPPKPAPAASDLDLSPDYILHDAKQIGAYTVQLWRHINDREGVMHSRAVISAPHILPLQIESAQAFGDLPASDITGEGDPDVQFKLRAVGSSHCCWGLAVYNFGALPSQVLQIWTPPYGYWDQNDVRDLNGDGRFEFIPREAVTGFPCTQPAAQVVLEYEADRGYVPASPNFPSAYIDLLARQTHMAEADRSEAAKGYKCGVLELILNYLYSGQSDKAWSELRRLYPASDADEFRIQIEQAVKQNPMYVQP